MMRRSLTAIAFSAVVVASAACGRSSPVPQVSLDEQGAETAAKGVCFDTKEELQAQLDDTYLGIDAPVVDQTQVDATVAAATSVDALRTKLDDVYQGIGGNGLSEADVRQFAREECFDTDTEVLDAITPALDAAYQAIDFHDDFANLQNIPAGLLDGDDDTPPTGTSPILVNGARNISLDTTSCNAGDALLLQGGGFACGPPAAPQSADSIGSTSANLAPVEGLPIITKIETNAIAIGAAGGNQDVTLNAGQRPKHKLFIVDAWAVGNGTTGAPTFELRVGGTSITTPVAAPVNAGDIARVTNFSGNIAARTIATNQDLTLRVSAAAAATGSFAVYILSMPAP